MAYGHIYYGSSSACRMSAGSLHAAVQHLLGLILICSHSGNWVLTALTWLTSGW